MRTRFWTSTALALGLTIAASAAAAEAPPSGQAMTPAFAADQPCAWLPDRDRVYPYPAQVQVTAAESKAIRENVRRISDFFRNDPRFSAPTGVCISFSNDGSWGRLEGGHAIMSGFMLGPWPADKLTRRGGKIVFDGEITHMVGSVNRMPDDVNNSISDAQGAMIMALSSVVSPSGTRFGLPVYDGAIVITLNDRPLFRPASYERMARWTLKMIDDKFAGGARKPAAAAVKAEQGQALARMSAAERAAPGCFVSEELEYGSKISLVVPASDRRCAMRMVEPNPDYFDRALPRSAIQLVSIRPAPEGPPRGTLAATRATEKDDWVIAAMLSGADWSRFRRDVMRR